MATIDRVASVAPRPKRKTTKECMDDPTTVFELRKRSLPYWCDGYYDVCYINSYTYHLGERISIKGGIERSITRCMQEGHFFLSNDVCPLWTQRVMSPSLYISLSQLVEMSKSGDFIFTRCPSCPEQIKFDLFKESRVYNCKVYNSLVIGLLQQKESGTEVLEYLLEHFPS